MLTLFLGHGARQLVFARGADTAVQHILRRRSGRHAVEHLADRVDVLDDVEDRVRATVWFRGRRFMAACGLATRPRTILVHPE